MKQLGFCILLCCVSGFLFGGEKPASEVKNPQAIAAGNKHNAAVKQAEAAYIKACITAKQQYRKELSDALQTVMKAGNFEEAKKIDELRKQVDADLTGLQKGNSPAGNIPKVPRVIDLMPLIDPSRDATLGHWKKDGALLISDTADPASICIRYQPPEEYDFSITFVRRSGNNGIGQWFMCGTGELGWLMGGWGNTICGFESIDGAPADRNPTTFKQEAIFVNGTRYRAIVKVRKDLVSAFINDKLVASFDPQSKSLHRHPSFNTGGKFLCVSSQNSAATFEMIELTEITGTGKPVLH